jgi:actin-related protein
MCCNVIPCIGGLSHITAKCIEMCDRDLQPDLLKNIVMAGASVMFPGKGPAAHYI